MTKPLDFKVIRGNPSADDLVAIEIALQVAKNSSEELLKQKQKVSNWNGPQFRFRSQPQLNSGWKYSHTSGA
jgi:hypothetical protein